MTKVTLTRESYNKLLEAERGLTDIVSELEKAEQCGIDCQSKREALRAQLQSIQSMKANFAPTA